MSRAFPFPPPTYMRNSVYPRGLVESIKIERGTEVSKTDPRKEKEQRERKKDGKERGRKSLKSRNINDGERKKEDEKLRHLEQKKVEDDTEQLEKSGLTDEHEPPQNLCYLSDGTQSDKKRKREDTPASQNQNQTQKRGKPPLRIRLVLRKPKESSDVLNQERLCSTSGAESQERLCSTSGAGSLTDHHEKVQGREAKTNIIASSSQSESDEKLQLDIQKVISKKQTSSKPTFQSLFGNWVPQELKFQLNEEEEDDQEWLFGSKKRAKSDVERIGTDNVGKFCGGSSWPKAQLLPNVGMYALPYTIPF